MLTSTIALQTKIAELEADVVELSDTIASIRTWAKDVVAWCNRQRNVIEIRRDVLGVADGGWWDNPEDIRIRATKRIRPWPQVTLRLPASWYRKHGIRN